MKNKVWQDMITDVRVYGLEEGIIASGYPMLKGSDDFSVSREITEKDLKRAKKLGSVQTGTGHDSFMKAGIIQFSIKMTSYLNLQFFRYHFVDVISSQSKLHKITESRVRGNTNKYTDDYVIDYVEKLIDEYHATDKNDKEKRYELFMRILSNCPSGLELTLRVSMSYLQAKTMYLQRRNHRLVEDWGLICDFYETLPYFKEFALGE